MKILITAGLMIAFTACGWIFGRSLQAQPNSHKGSPVTTNWVGSLVIGQEESMDRIGRGLYPTTVHQVEIGLRSDGVVVWRTPTNTITFRK